MTQTKLTLRMDDKMVKKAKEYAGKHGRSVSELVENYFAALETEPAIQEADLLPPEFQAMRGLLEGVSEEDYYKYLEEKYS